MQQREVLVVYHQINRHRAEHPYEVHDGTASKVVLYKYARRLLYRIIMRSATTKKRDHGGSRGVVLWVLLSNSLALLFHVCIKNEKRSRHSGWLLIHWSTSSTEAAVLRVVGPKKVKIKSTYLGDFGDFPFPPPSPPVFFCFVSSLQFK